jgi:hypothetical protein
MSGFSTKVRAGGPPFSFFSLVPKASSTRQSATAATNTPTSAGRAAWLAASISRAVSTSTRVDAGGVGKNTGPLIRVTSAPSWARASAIAKPCRPLERLVMPRTGSIGSKVGRR